MSYAELLLRHYAERWSPPIATLRWDKGPTHDLPDDFRVVVVRRSADTIAYATLCMSQPDDEDRTELHLLTRTRERIESDIVELVTAVAHYHRTGRRLGVGDSACFGRRELAAATVAFAAVEQPE